MPMSSGGYNDLNGTSEAPPSPTLYMLPGKGS